MKMDVSYTDHSHIIGKGGLSIKRVMEETQCHVHFPDSNRSNPTEKSNQVSISGDIEGVECARSRVRVKTINSLSFYFVTLKFNNSTCLECCMGWKKSFWALQKVFKLSRLKLKTRIWPFSLS